VELIRSPPYSAGTGAGVGSTGGALVSVWTGGAVLAGAG
jgi:hypothetical protein